MKRVSYVQGVSTRFVKEKNAIARLSFIELH